MLFFFFRWESDLLLYLGTCCRVIHRGLYSDRRLSNVGHNRFTDNDLVLYSMHLYGYHSKKRRDPIFVYERRRRSLFQQLPRRNLL